MLRSLRFRLPALFLAGVLVAALVTVWGVGYKVTPAKEAATA